MERGWSWTLFSDAQWQDQSHWPQAQTQEVPSEHQNPLFFFLTVRMSTEHWQRLSVRAVEYPSSEIHKTCLDTSPGQLVLVVPAWTRKLAQVASRDPFQPWPFCDLVFYGVSKFTVTNNKLLACVWICNSITSLFWFLNVHFVWHSTVNKSGPQKMLQQMKSTTGQRICLHIVMTMMNLKMS